MKYRYDILVCILSYNTQTLLSSSTLLVENERIEREKKKIEWVKWVRISRWGEMPLDVLKRVDSSSISKWKWESARCDPDTNEIKNGRKEGETRKSDGIICMYIHTYYLYPRSDIVLAV